MNPHNPGELNVDHHIQRIFDDYVAEWQGSRARTASRLPSPGRPPLPTDMLTAKIEYGFDQLTMRSGGVLNGPSHVAMGRRAAAAIGYALGSADEGRMIEAYLTIWRLVHLPHLPAGSRGLTKEEFVRSNLALADDPAAREDTLGALADTFFELADHDRDERVNREEFWAFQHGHFPELT